MRIHLICVPVPGAVSSADSYKPEKTRERGEDLQLQTGPGICVKDSNRRWHYRGLQASTWGAVYPGTDSGLGATG